MTQTRLTLGYVPLVDAAPLIIAHELGFAEQEGLVFDLRAESSWATLRDLLALGQIEAAQMLAPIPIAMALGLGGLPTRLDVLSVLSVNGNVTGVSRELAARIRAAGHDFAFNDAVAAGNALIAASGGRLRVGVPFPFSMHAELLYYWLGALGLRTPQELDVHTVPPPLMAEALAAGEIDAFSVGAPWGSIAVENGVGELLLPNSAIWAFAPEKVLTVRHGWAEDNPGLAIRLIRAVWRAGRWLQDRDNRLMATDILARPDYLNVPAEVMERALTGELILSPRGERRHVPHYLVFHDGAATFPWRSQASWIAQRLASRLGLDRVAADAAARQVFRTDLYRSARGGLSDEIPGASEKVEGAVEGRAAVPGQSGVVILHRDRFFDGMVFDPSP